MRRSQAQGGAGLISSFGTGRLACWAVGGLVGCARVRESCLQRGARARVIIAVHPPTCAPLPLMMMVLHQALWVTPLDLLLCGGVWEALMMPPATVLPWLSMLKRLNDSTDVLKVRGLLSGAAAGATDCWCNGLLLLNRRMG